MALDESVSDRLRAALPEERHADVDLMVRALLQTVRERDAAEVRGYARGRAEREAEVNWPPDDPRVEAAKTALELLTDRASAILGEPHADRYRVGRADGLLEAVEAVELALAHAETKED